MTSRMAATLSKLHMTNCIFPSFLTPRPTYTKWFGFQKKNVDVILNCSYSLFLSGNLPTIMLHIFLTVTSSC